MRRKRPLLLLLPFLLFAIARPGVVAGADPLPPQRSDGPTAGSLPPSTVDLQNDGTMSVSVPLGTDNGVTAESDFAVLGKDNTVLLHIYPFELYTNRFWSQPLAASVFSRVFNGMEVREAELAESAHMRVRVEGEVRRREYREKQQEARREAARVETGELKGRRGLLEGRREELDGRIADAEKDMVDEESRMEWLTGSEDRDIDRSLDEILSMAEERDELQLRRLSLSRQTPVPRDEIDRLTSEIRRINDRLESERGRIRSARDRKRSARYAFQSRRKEWQQLVAERRRIAGEIDALDRQLRELSEIMK